MSLLKFFEASDRGFDNMRSGVFVLRGEECSLRHCGAIYKYNISYLPLVL